MKNKPTIFFIAFFFFDIRLLTTAGLIKALAEKARIVLFVPPDSVEAVKDKVPDSVVVEAIRYPELGNKIYKIGGKLRTWMVRIVHRTFLITYAEPARRPNRTADFQMRTRLRQAAKVSLWQLLLVRVLQGWVYLVSRSWLLRKGLQKWFLWLGTPDDHADLFKRYQPSLTVSCSFGQSADGHFMAESRKNRVKTAVISASWDKTSCKGYPVFVPDHSIVWNYVMRDEVRDYLELPEERVHVVGAFLWDQHFNYSPGIDRETFCKQRGFDPNGAIIFFSLGGAGYLHNREAVAALVDAMVHGRFRRKAQLLLRLHPDVLKNEERLEEIRSFMTQYEELPGFFYEEPLVRGTEEAITFQQNDFEHLASLFAFSDVNISVMSSHMLEASLFDCPAITLRFGTWKTNLLEEDLKRFNPEHIMRILATGAIREAYSPEELVDLVNEALEHPEARQPHRRELMEQEAPVNRGHAVSACVSALMRIAKG